VLRADRRSPQDVRLCALQRVVRAQHASGPRTFAHFDLFAMVTAGRDTGGHRFEAEAAVHHIVTLTQGLRRAGAHAVRVTVTDHEGRGHAEDVVDRLRADGIGADEDPHRTHGRGYYAGLCFKLHIANGGEEVEVGDGGVVAWTQRLLHSRKERLMISGLGIDRVAMTSAPPQRRSSTTPASAARHRGA
jgi:hypothetical protein